eukprot:UN03886
MYPHLKKIDLLFSVYTLSPSSFTSQLNQIFYETIIIISLIISFSIFFIYTSFSPYNCIQIVFF